MRLTIGSFLQLWLAAAIALGRAVGDRQKLAIGTSAVIGLGAVFVLLDHTYIGSVKHSILGTAAAPDRVPRPPTQLPDLRDEIIARYPDPLDQTPYIGFAADHANLNHYNLQLRLLEGGKEASMVQIGYMAPELRPVDRIVAHAGARLWVIIDTGGNWNSQSTFAKNTAGVMELLRAHPQIFRELDWVGQLTPQAKVRLFQTIGDPNTLRDAGSGK